MFGACNDRWHAHVPISAENLDNAANGCRCGDGRYVPCDTGVVPGIGPIISSAMVAAIDNSARCPLLPQQRRLAAYLISLLSEHGFPVMPKSFPVNFHREYRKKPLWMPQKTMASSLPYTKFCDFPC